MDVSVNHPKTWTIALTSIEIDNEGEELCTIEIILEIGRLSDFICSVLGDEGVGSA